jgi:hypothetical protein
MATMQALIRGRTLCALVFGVCLLTPPHARAGMITLDFSNVPNTSISFDGSGNFTFTTASGNGFNITGQTGLSNSVVGLDGSISGTYTIGSITTTSTILGTLESAPVTGSGTFSIFDGNGKTLTAAVDFVSIYTLGTSGALNSSGTINLSNFNYSGTNSDLTDLSSAKDGSVTITFNFDPAVALTDLAGPNAHSNSYSGTLTADTGPGPNVGAPEPSTALLSLIGLPIVGFWMRRRAKAAKAAA